jgi:hypothetical protein
VKGDRDLARASRPLHWWQKLRTPSLMWQWGIRCLFTALVAMILGLLFVLHGRYIVVGALFIVAASILTLLGVRNFRDYTRRDQRRGPR